MVIGFGLKLSDYDASEQERGVDGVWMNMVDGARENPPPRAKGTVEARKYNRGSRRTEQARASYRAMVAGTRGQHVRVPLLAPFNQSLHHYRYVSPGRPGHALAR